MTKNIDLYETEIEHIGTKSRYEKKVKVLSAFKGVKTIKKNWSKQWGLYPNIGIGEPSPNGVILNYHSDKEFLELVDKSIHMGASVIGGCCGSNPNHISLIKQQIKQKES